MKKLIGVLLTAVMILEAAAVSVKGEPSAISADFRAVWVSSVLNLDYPSKPGLTKLELMAEADYIMDKAAELGLNAIIFQARPSGDALYNSLIYPWSEYLSGVQGKAPDENFDPLAYFVDGCHKRGLELHAWINPYRISHSVKKVTDVNALSEDNPARINPAWVKSYQGGLYLDPGIPECQRLIIDGIVELIQEYEIDGIHLDDYFYPGPDFDDATSYAMHGGGADRNDWRRENVNILIQGIQEVVKFLNPDIRFGISPFAIWRNQSSDPLGSETFGFESYSSIFSDSRRWVLEGWLDYVCPQIYWNIGFETADYSKVLAWWLDLCDGAGVDLYIGTAAYKEDGKDTKWNGEIVRQLTYSRQFTGVSGHVFFRFGSINGTLGQKLKEYYASDGFGSAVAPVIHDIPNPATVTMDKLTVVQPVKDVSVTGAKGYYIFGACDPNAELFVNGFPVEERTSEGFFSVYAVLNPGSNTFTFTQPNQTPVTRTITVKEASAASASTPEPVTLTEYAETTPYYATVSAETAWLYPGGTTTGGSSWTLLKGQKDKVTAVTSNNQWVKLSCGGWVEAKDVALAMDDTLRQNVLSGGVYIPGAYEDIIAWNAEAYPAVGTELTDGVLTFLFGMHTRLPDIDMPQGQGLEGTMFSSITGGYKGDTPYYAFTLRETAGIEGYYTDFSDGQFRLHIKKRRSLADGELPLSGFTIVVDAGHGDTEIGAKGPMGETLPEKTLNLSVSLLLAQRLRELGANVVLTRETDAYRSLYDRTEISRAAKPDMFVSIHSNSLVETTDATAVRGLTVWYRNSVSLPLAQAMIQRLHMTNPYTTRRQEVNQSNLYVCRPSWAPSVIIECSFMNNIHDFAWLINDNSKRTLANDIADAILDYYGNLE